MARLKGIIKITGTINELNFYTRKGSKEIIVRGKTGPSSEQVKKDKAFERTRENAKEFGGGSRAGKVLRDSLFPYSKEIGNSFITGDLTKLFQRMAQLGEGLRGKRSIKPNFHKDLLIGFDFNKDQSMESILKSAVNVHVDKARQNISLTISALIPSKNVKAPSGATHVEFIHLVTLQPAFEYNTDLNEYQRMDGQSQSSQFSILSEKIAVRSSKKIQVSLPISIAETTTIHSDSVIVSALAIRFYQQVGDTMYLLEEGKAMRVVAVE